MRIFMDQVVNKEPIAAEDKIVSLVVNEKYDYIVLLKSGRQFKARAKGHAGSYDTWREIDLLGEIKKDLKI